MSQRMLLCQGLHDVVPATASRLMNQQAHASQDPVLLTHVLALPSTIVWTEQRTN